MSKVYYSTIVSNGTYIYVLACRLIIEFKIVYFSKQKIKSNLLLDKYYSF